MLLWPALDYLIKLFFHHEQTFFLSSTYPTPWVAGETLSSPAASRWWWVTPWTSHQFDHKEKSSHPCFHEVATWLQVHVFVLWVEAGVPGGKSQGHRGIMATHHTDTQIPLAWSMLVCNLTPNLLVLKRRRKVFALLDGSDSIGLIMMATSVPSKSWTYVDYSSKLFIGNWKVLFRLIYCPVFLVAVQV